MKDAGKNTGTVLVRWSYTREEWKRFARWDNWRRGFLGFVLKKISHPCRRHVQDITIAEGCVCFDQQVRLLKDDHMQVRRVDIAESGSMNTLEIIYETQTGSSKQIKEILIPVPRGKLREAVEVQERLQQAFGV